jgi:hypothetical protein
LQEWRKSASADAMPLSQRAADHAYNPERPSRVPGVAASFNNQGMVAAAASMLEEMT